MNIEIGEQSVFLDGFEKNSITRNLFKVTLLNCWNNSVCNNDSSLPTYAGSDYFIFVELLVER